MRSFLAKKGRTLLQPSGPPHPNWAGGFPKKTIVYLFLVSMSFFGVARAATVTLVNSDVYDHACCFSPTNMLAIIPQASANGWPVAVTGYSALTSAAKLGRHAGRKLLGPQGPSQLLGVPLELYPGECLRLPLPDGYAILDDQYNSWTNAYGYGLTIVWGAGGITQGLYDTEPAVQASRWASAGFVAAVGLFGFYGAIRFCLRQLLSLATASSDATL